METNALQLLPPTHEQSLPTFLIDRNLLTEFLDFLDEHGLQPWEPPEVIGAEGGSENARAEIQMPEESTQDQLEALRVEFLERRSG